MGNEWVEVTPFPIKIRNIAIFDENIKYRNMNILQPPGHKPNCTTFSATIRYRFGLLLLKITNAKVEDGGQEPRLIRIT